MKWCVKSGKSCIMCVKSSIFFRRLDANAMLAICKRGLYYIFTIKSPNILNFHKKRKKRLNAIKINNINFSSILYNV